MNKRQRRPVTVEVCWRRRMRTWTWTWPIWLCVLLSQLTSTWTFRSIDDYYFNIGVEEKLRDVRLLPNGEEVTVYLFQEEPQSYFFPLDINDAPVSITVTPCSSTIEWKVYYHSPRHIKRFTGLEGDPLHLQESGYRGQGLGFTHLHAYQGKDMSTYRTNNEHLSKGTLRIVLVSKDENSHVKILVTKADEENPAFPQLPSTPDDVDIIANDHHSVTVAWKPSPSNYLKGVRIKYCVAFNPRYNYRTLCALREAVEGQSPPPWPKNAGFGFAWETSWKQRIASLRKSLSKAVKTRRDIYFECVGGRQWATVNSLLPGRRYNVNVFAINEYTNMSVAYAGTTFVTTASSTDHPQPVLRPGAVYSFQLDPDVTYHAYSFQLRSDTVKNVAIFVQGCQQQTTAEVIYEGAVIVRDVPVHNVQKILLKQADVGNYTLRFKMDQSDHPVDRQVKVCFMYNSDKCPFNAAPSDYRLILKSKNDSSTYSDCHRSHLTLQWSSAANFNAKYCLYAHKLSHQIDYDYDDEVEERDRCAQMTLSADDRLFCRQYKRNSPNRRGKRIVETLNLNLEADRVYRFHLQVMFKRNVTIDYQPTQMLILNNCH